MCGGEPGPHDRKWTSLGRSLGSFGIGMGVERLSDTRGLCDPLLVVPWVQGVPGPPRISTAFQPLFWKGVDFTSLLEPWLAPPLVTNRLGATGLANGLKCHENLGVP